VIWYNVTYNDFSSNIRDIIYLYDESGNYWSYSKVQFHRGNILWKSKLKGLVDDFIYEFLEFISHGWMELQLG
jgi:hypothetical protein